MSEIFKEVRLHWGDAEHVIASSEVMRVIAIIENHITLGDLSRWAGTNSVPLGRLAMAYGSVLRFAGVKVSDPEVYASFFKSAEMADRVARSIGELLMLMIPPDAAKAAEEGKTVAGKAGPAVVAVPSSRRHTRPPSAGA